MALRQTSTSCCLSEKFFQCPLILFVFFGFYPGLGYESHDDGWEVSVGFDDFLSLDYRWPPQFLRHGRGKRRCRTAEHREGQ